MGCNHSTPIYLTNTSSICRDTLHASDLWSLEIISGSSVWNIFMFMAPVMGKTGDVHKMNLNVDHQPKPGWIHTNFTDFGFNIYTTTCFTFPVIPKLLFGFAKWYPLSHESLFLSVNLQIDRRTNREAWETKYTHKVIKNCLKFGKTNDFSLTFCFWKPSREMDPVHTISQSLLTRHLNAAVKIHLRFGWLELSLQNNQVMVSFPS